MRVRELGHLVLVVRDVERSAAFYRDTLGFAEVGRLESGAVAFSGGGTHHELLLVPAKAGAAPSGPTVLRHFALKVGDDDADLRDALASLRAANVEITRVMAAVHTHSVYVRDPDGNEVELYIDVQPEIWREDVNKALNTPPVPFEP
jgi:catechol-2,3-dioxygenase